ncbi:MAG: phosphoribosylglycinamide formyltransferase [Desulfobulbales bacterium]
MQKMAVLLSGSGRTLDNFHDRIQDGSLQAEIKVVISNVKDVLGLQKAAKYGYPHFHAVGNAATNNVLKEYDVNLICLAGYVKLYEPPPELVRHVLNIHPALIPSFCGDGFYGMRVHRAVKAKGVMVSGCTVHFADNKYDQGPIVVQKCVPLEYDDTPEEIAAKVFGAECLAFPEAINLVDEKGVDFFWRRVANEA